MDTFSLDKNTLPHNRQETEALLFKLGMWWRIFYGVLRVIVGVTLLGYIGTHFVDILYYIMQPELMEDASNKLYAILNDLLSKTSLTVTSFLAVYLIFWGTVDIFLSTLLLRHVLWAFPVSIYLMYAFIIYELYRLTHTHSLILLFFIFVDVSVVWLIRREQQRRCAQQ